MNIAEEYEDLGKHARTEEICYQVISGWPGSKKAVGAQTKIAKMAINQQEFDKARTAVDNLLMLPEYCRSEWIMGAVMDITWSYRRANKPEECERIYNYIVSNWPEPDYTGSTQQAAKAIANIGLGRNAQGDALLDDLIADHKNESELARTVFQIGEQYYYTAFELQHKGDIEGYRYYLQRAQQVWAKITAELEGWRSSVGGHIYYYNAVCYRRLADYYKAVEYNQKLLEYYPDYIYNWSAHYLMGLSYERMAQTGLVSKEEATDLAEDAYKKVVETYPGCGSYKSALRRLGNMNYEVGDWADTALYYELLLQELPDDQQAPAIIYRLGKSYEELGMEDLALKSYRDYIRKPGARESVVSELKNEFNEL